MPNGHQQFGGSTEAELADPANCPTRRFVGKLSLFRELGYRPVALFQFSHQQVGELV